MTTRRLAAILAVGTVGYSRLMGADEEGTLRCRRCGHPPSELHALSYDSYLSLILS
jgi:hypothetical protein